MATSTRVYTASDGSRHRTSSQAKAEQLARSRQQERQLESRRATRPRKTDPLGFSTFDSQTRELADAGIDDQQPTVILSGQARDAQGNKIGDRETTVSYSDRAGKRRTVPQATYDAFAYSVLPRINRDKAGSLIKDAGLKGLLNEEDITGLTESEARDRLADFKEDRAGSGSALTSYAFNPERTAGAKKIFEDFRFRLRDTMNDGWASRGTKQEKARGLFESTANEYAKLFDTAQDFESALTQDRSFQRTIRAFERAGGDVDAIRTRIGQAAPMTPAATPGQAPPVASISAPGGVPQAQTTQDYMTALTAPPADASASDRQAFESLLPERQLAQDRIATSAAIPQQYKELYFGTPEQMGIIEQRKIEAQQSKKLLEKEAKNEKATQRARAQLQIQQNELDAEIEDAEIEENRLIARNFMTAQLAKMGALNTTGAAPLALATLEQKYQQEKRQLRSQLKLSNREIEIGLMEKINRLELERDEGILKLQQDETKDREEVMKEVLKLEQSSDKEIYGILDKAAGEFRTQRDKYVREARTLAKRNLSAAGGAAGKKQASITIEQDLAASRGEDGFVDPQTYLNAYNKWISQRRGTLKEFTNAFPPKNYVNPANTWLPAFLRPAATKSKGPSGTTIDVL